MLKLMRVLATANYNLTRLPPNELKSSHWKLIFVLGAYLIWEFFLFNGCTYRCCCYTKSNKDQGRNKFKAITSIKCTNAALISWFSPSLSYCTSRMEIKSYYGNTSNKELSYSINLEYEDYSFLRKWTKPSESTLEVFLNTGNGWLPL